MREATTVPQRGRRKYDDDDDDKETDVEQRGGQPAAVIGRLQVGNNLDLEENFERRDVQLHSLLTRWATISTWRRTLRGEMSNYTVF